MKRRVYVEFNYDGSIMKMRSSCGCRTNKNCVKSECQKEDCLNYGYLLSIGLGFAEIECYETEPSR